MLPAKKKATNLGIGVGILLQVASLAIRHYWHTSWSAYVGFGVGVVGFVAFIAGCIAYAEGKGQPAEYGALGVLTFFGLLILALIPDNYKGWDNDDRI